jgi:hypothetical protein
MGPSASVAAMLISTARLFIVNVILVSSPVFQMNSRKLACSK